MQESSVFQQKIKAQGFVAQVQVVAKHLASTIKRLANASSVTSVSTCMSEEHRRHPEALGQAGERAALAGDLPLAGRRLGEEKGRTSPRSHVVSSSPVNATEVTVAHLCMNLQQPLHQPEETEIHFHPGRVDEIVAKEGAREGAGIRTGSEDPRTRVVVHLQAVDPASQTMTRWQQFAFQWA